MKKLNIILTVLLIFTFLSSLTLKAEIKATAKPASSTVATGQQITIPIVIDISKVPEKIGSFTAALDWDPQVLKYVQHSSGTSKEFSNPMVNTNKSEKGMLIFAAANPRGANGVLNVLNLTFEAVGQQGSKTSIGLKFTAMAAAQTYEDLTKYLSLATDVKDEIRIGEIPKEFGLLQNYPNPFNPSTEIKYQIPKEEFVQLTIFNSAGQVVRELEKGKKPIGSYTVEWDGKNELGNMVPAGLYIYRFEAGEFKSCKKMLLVK